MGGTVSGGGGASIKYEADGNYYWHARPPTGSAVGLSKTFHPIAEGVYEINLRVRVSSLGSPRIGLTIRVGTWSVNTSMTASNTWISLKGVMGYLPSKPFDVRLSFYNVTYVDYSLDDICLRQLPYP